MVCVQVAVGRRLAPFVAAALVALAFAARADAALVTQPISFTADDGVVLHATVGGEGSIARRPLIVEDSPYAPGIDAFAGPAYNYVELQWRGTGLSGGSLGSTGSRDQRDLSEFLGWACGQPWSNGRTGLYGFSASAIIAYNSMRLGLPCVKGAALMSGTVDLYRDLLDIGGIGNTAPGMYVEGAILAPWLQDLPGRLQQQPASTPASALGFATAPVDVSSHATEDGYWLDRTFKGDPQRIPILADDGFYDVESRGAFLAYRATRRYGSHLLVIGAHDGWPSNTPGPFPQYARWFDHYVRGVGNGVDRDPPVSLYLSNGSHKQSLNGNWTHLDGSAWPLPRTSWTRLYLSPAKSGSASSLNDGTLSSRPLRSQTVQSYPFAPSDALETDPHTISTLSGGSGFSLDGAATYVPALTDMQVAEPMSLTYTLPPFKTAVDAVGPASLDVWASSTAPATDLVAILADVGARRQRERGRDRPAPHELSARRPVALAARPADARHRRAMGGLLVPGRRGARHEARVPPRDPADRKPLRGRPPPAPLHRGHLERSAGRDPGPELDSARRPNSVAAAVPDPATAPAPAPSPRLATVTPRIPPGTRREVGALNWGIARLLGLASGSSNPPRLFTTLARNRRLFRPWLRFAGALMPGGKLPRADSELVILRVAHNCACEYEWRHHERLARSAGLDRDAVARVRDGAQAPGWTARQAALLRAADELHERRTLSDESWQDLRPHLTDDRAVELFMLIGHYEMLAMTLNALRVEPDTFDGVHGRVPELLQRLASRRSGS